MFKTVTRVVMKELDSDGDLHPLSSIIESKLLEVLSVVKIVESRKFWLLKSVRYRPTGVKLHELLQCPDTVDCGGSQKTDIGTVDIMQDGCGNVGVSFGESILWNNSKVDKRHFLIQQVQSNSKIRGLGVIYQIVKADNLNLGQKSRGQASVNVSAVEAATLDAGGKVDQERKLKLGGGCALAFKVLPLDVKGPKKQLVMDNDDFKELKKSVTNELKAFTNMDWGTKKSIWDDLSRTTKCPQALYILDCMLEEGHVSADSPSPLDEVPGNLREGIQKLLELVSLYDSDFSGPDSLLSSLGLVVSSAAVLDEEAVNLTINLGGEDRGQMLKLVEAALEKVCSGDFSDPQWSKRFSESIVSLTNQILALCGLKLGEDTLDPSLGTSGAPDGALLALYILLLGGNMLLES
ncbi:hypothetical protein AGOR_G00202940 [Albula goreensis]|uniref:Gasdermin pore forming domain-containing protein n=1 Tax=Albula goreensis TaxID=1534307 RepID=A0A8T3CXH9_9TELE|nr:hypothetical protein AGOR_G00202940 [Albula goreensis]